MNVLMRNLKRLTLSVLFVSASTTTVNAGLPTIDLAHIGVQTGFWTADTAEQVIQTGEAIVQTVEDITQTAQQIQMVYNLAQSLDTLAGATEFLGLANDLTIQDADITRLMGTVKRLNYTASAIPGQINGLYPKGNGWQSYNFANIKRLRQTWNDTMSEAVEGAMAAQSMISKIDNRNQRIKRLLSRGASEDGQVRQLQVNNQMTAALIESINDMNQSIAATQRAVMIEQKTRVAEREIKAEQFARLTSGYTHPGPAVAVPTALPAVH